MCYIHTKMDMSICLIAANIYDAYVKHRAICIGTHMQSEQLKRLEGENVEPRS